MALEVELKLAIDPVAAAGFWKALASRLPRLRPARRTLFSAYYDTRDGHLRRHGVALRLRRESGRWIQTVKRSGEAAAGLHSRFEHEVEVAAQLPSFPAMQDAGIGDLIADRRVRDALRVAFITEFDRVSALAAPAPGTTIEIALDRGEIVAEGRRESLCEVELELKSGEPGALFELAQWIATQIAVRPDNRSKAERGFRLASGERAAPVKSGPSPVGKDMTATAAMRRLAFQCVAQLQANERGLLAGRNPEYLHQARVALRRLRSLFRVFEPILAPQAQDRLSARLRELARCLGEARNLDVFAAETLPRTGNFVHPGMAMLRRTALQARRRASRTAREAVADRAYAGLMLDLAVLFSADGTAAAPPVDAFAREALGRLLKRARRRARGLQSLGYADLHRLRIALKRLRYAMEFFEPLWPDAMPGMLEALGGLQDRLGRLNDDATAWKLLDALAVENVQPDFQQAVGFVRGSTAQDAERCLDGLPEAWKRFGRMKPAWR